MNSQIKPIKFSHHDFTFERSLRFHLIKRPTTIQTLDFRCIHNNKHRREIYRILKQTRKVNSVSLVVSTVSQPNAIFTLLAQKTGIKTISLNGHSKNKDVIPFLDRQALDWYPVTLHDQPNINIPGVVHDVPISRVLPKTITSLKFSLFFISRMSLYRLSQSVKRIRGLKELELMTPAKNDTVLKKDAVIFENMFTFKKKLERVCFHSHLGKNSLASFKDALKNSPLKSVTIYQDLGFAFDYSADKLKSFLESQRKLETLDIIVVRKDPGNAGVFTNLINAVAQNLQVRNFRFDTQIPVDATEANIIKEALKSFKELKSLRSQFNHNFNAVNAGRAKIDSINLEAAKIRQLTTRTMVVKNTQDPQINLKIIKSVCHDIFNSTQLKHLEITSKVEIHETALLYLLWGVKNMPALETLKFKTALEIGTMIPMSDIQKMPNFTTPTSLKTLFLEWATEFEYTEKIIDFIALQKNLKNLHLGIMRVGNPSSKDYSKLFSKLASLNNLVSFHILSTSISLFRSTFFDLYAKIVKNSPNLVNIGLTFLAPYLHESSLDSLMINPSKIELTPNLCGFLDEISKKKGVRKLYLNFKINADNEQNLGQLVGLLCEMKGLIMLSICLEMFYKKELTEDEIKFMKKIVKKQMLRLDHIEYCFVGMLKGLANSPTMAKVLKSAVKKMKNLEGVCLMNGLPLKMNDKLGGNISA